MHYADHDSSRAMLTRGEVIETHENDDDLALATIYGHDGEVLKKVHRLQLFGYAYRPRKGAHGMVLSSGGRRDEALFFGGENHQKRPRDLGEGENAMYNDYGEKLWMKNGHVALSTQGRSTINTGTDHTIETGTDTIIKTGGICHINP